MGFVVAGKSGRKKRFWCDEEKASICAQARTDGVSVAQVARRYAMNANLIHKWLRDPRFASDLVTDIIELQAATFLPVEVSDLGISASPGVINLSEPCGLAISGSGPNSGVQAHRVEITLSDGRRVLVEGNTELDGIIDLVKGLMS